MWFAGLFAFANAGGLCIVTSDKAGMAALRHPGITAMYPMVISRRNPKGHLTKGLSEVSFLFR